METTPSDEAPKTAAAGAATSTSTPTSSSATSLVTIPGNRRSRPSCFAPPAPAA